MCTRLGITKTRTAPLHPQSDGLVERFNRTLGQQLSILTTTHQRDWDMHLPLVLMACRTAVQDSTSCTPSLLMLGRELRTLAELAFGQPLDAPQVPAGPNYARRLQDRLDSAHVYARRQMRSAGVRQKRNYDLRAKGWHFEAGSWCGPTLLGGRKADALSWTAAGWDLVWSWSGLGRSSTGCRCLGRGRRVALHRDRLAPYRGIAYPQTAGAGGEMPLMPVVASPHREVVTGGPDDSASASPARSSPPAGLGPPELGHMGGPQTDATPVGQPQRGGGVRHWGLKTWTSGTRTVERGGVL